MILALCTVFCFQLIVFLCVVGRYYDLTRQHKSRRYRRQDDSSTEASYPGTNRHSVMPVPYGVAPMAAPVAAAPMAYPFTGTYGVVYPGAYGAAPYTMSMDRATMRAAKKQRAAPFGQFGYGYYAPQMGFRTLPHIHGYGRR